MKRVLTLCVAGLWLAACGKGDGVAEPAAKSAEYPELTRKLDKIAKAVDEAKTTRHFAQINMDCGSIEIAAAADNINVTETPRFIELCHVSPTRARAKLAIAESTPARMSVHCMAVAMNIEELVQKGVEAQAMNKLLDQVRTACHM